MTIGSFTVAMNAPLVRHCRRSQAIQTGSPRRCAPRDDEALCGAHRRGARLVQIPGNGYSGGPMKAAPFALTFSFVALAACIAPAVSQPEPAAPVQAKAPQFAWPERMRNAQVLAADTSPDQLRDTMRSFTSA